MLNKVMSYLFVILNGCRHLCKVYFSPSPNHQILIFEPNKLFNKLITHTPHTEE